MRRGELLGLQWGDVGLNAGTLRVERSLEETKAGLRFKPPKTKRGRRNITLPPDAVAMLRTHKIKQLQVRLVLGLGKIEPWRASRSSRIPSAAHGSALSSPRDCHTSRSTR